jgi:dihydroorotate dehydrogenase (fumarate)
MDLSTNLGGLRLANPLLPASGPLTGDAAKLLWMADQGVGALVTKTIGLEAAVVPRPCITGGKDWLRNAELWSEFGPDEWEKSILPGVKAKTKLPLVVSLGYTEADLRQLVPRLDRFADAFEVSTHYVGTDLAAIGRTVEALRSLTDKPVFLKVSPHLPDPVGFAKTVLAAGATGVAAINSLGPTLGIDLARRAVAWGNPAGEAWTSGPVIKPLALALVRRIKDAVPECVVIGTGGVQSAEDVVEFLLAGADAVQMLSAALLKGKDLYAKIVAALPLVLEKYGFGSVADVTATRLSPYTPRWEPRVPVVDKHTCTRCGLCDRICPYFAMTAPKSSPAKADPRACFGCGLCESKCPVGAISGVLTPVSG